jgi:hypothetical protein
MVCHERGVGGKRDGHPRGMLFEHSVRRFEENPRGNTRKFQLHSSSAVFASENEKERERERERRREKERAPCVPLTSMIIMFGELMRGVTPIPLR